ncbi:MAG: selenocysteine-specific translation elongation factor, partial [Dehalococcoidia bacterium]|nr:selenocysteine-specific translation elongation factor [Dehalococcoidia bacterium]
MLVVGTAGHVDHGKSTLIKALTGIDPDRLQEEKDRGMTIDLGFAWLTLPSGREVSIVDVPGHERFIKNMLAGVGGIDLALLVVAADEGVMPQTREHLGILDLLQVKSGLVAITKKDLVDDDWLELVTADVEELLEPTCLKGSPLLAVSAVTRDGLPQLLEAMDRLLETTPERIDLGRPRLPVDRVFTITGFGTVVTGTLIDGSLSVGQEIEVLPRGLKVRVRGLQTHKHKIERALPGSRVAVNLSGVPKEDLLRGDVLTTPGWLLPTTAVDVRLRILDDVPRPVVHNTPVSFHTASSEASGRVRLLDKEELGPGESGWAQVRLDSPLAPAKGDHFIIRSPNETLGGGRIIALHPRRHRRFHPPTIQGLELAEKGSPEELLVRALDERSPCPASEASRLSGLTWQEAKTTLGKLISQRKIEATGAGPLESETYLISPAGWSRLRETVESLLKEYHRRLPLRPGMPREELKSKLGLPPRPLADVLQRLALEGEIVETRGWVRHAQYEVKLAPAQQAKVDSFMASLKANPYSPSSDQPLEADLLSLLIEEGRVVKVAEGVV